MKRLFQLPIIACAFLIIAGSTSCKKDKKSDPVCRIATASTTSSSGTTLMSITYNGDGKIASITEAGASTSSKTFTYSGNTINIVEKSGTGAIINTYDVTLNNAGNITSIITKDAAGAIESTASLTYDANGYLQRFITSSIFGTDTATTTFSEGNLTSLVSGSSVSVLSYYTDKTFMDGDYLKFAQIYEYGALYIVNRNLIKSIVNGPITTNFVYEFDNTGKITKATSTSGTSIETVNYSYNCN